MYNNPNFYGYGSMYNYNPGMMYYSKPSFFKRLTGNFNFNNFLNQTSKTLNVINQAIPIVYQVKPMISNARTMFKIANIIKSDDNKNESSKSNSNTLNHQDTHDENIKKEENISSNQPTFFL